MWSVLYDRDRIISGSEDMTIKIWDSESGMCMNTLKGHKNGTVSCLSLFILCYSLTFRDLPRYFWIQNCVWKC